MHLYSDGEIELDEELAEIELHDGNEHVTHSLWASTELVHDGNEHITHSPTCHPNSLTAQ